MGHRITTSSFAVCEMVRTLSSVWKTALARSSEYPTRGSRQRGLRLCLPPFLPTLSQLLNHSVTHYPYQSWCPYCVESRGREFGHSRAMKESSATPTISFDYAFFSDGEEVESQEAYEAAGETALQLLVARWQSQNDLRARGAEEGI